MSFQFLILVALAMAADAGYVGGHSSSSLQSLSFGRAGLSGGGSGYSGNYGFSAPAPAAPLPIAAPAKAYGEDSYDPNPAYKYNYAITDDHTGDQKTQEEERIGDVVKGSYSLVEPDGSIRKVEYIADPKKGFNAHITRTPGGHPPPAKPLYDAPPQYH